VMKAQELGRISAAPVLVEVDACTGSVRAAARVHRRRRAGGQAQQSRPATGSSRRQGSGRNAASRPHDWDQLLATADGLLQCSHIFVCGGD
jgi:hypothetical protein